MPLNENAVNEILPFAPEGVEAMGDLFTHEEYLNSLLRLRGHQPGIAERGVQNRANRQAAHMAAGAAQFLANRYAAGVRDDGDLDKVEEAWLRVIEELALAAAARVTRKIITEPLTVYVRVDGDDRAGADDPLNEPFRTISGALRYLSTRVYVGTHDCTIRVANGSYTEVVRACLPDAYSVSWGAMGYGRPNIHIIGDSKAGVEINGCVHVVRSGIRLSNFSLNIPKIGSVAGLDAYYGIYGLYGSYIDVENVDVNQLNGAGHYVAMIATVGSILGASGSCGIAGNFSDVFCATYFSRLASGAGTAIKYNNVTVTRANMYLSRACDADWFMVPTGTVTGRRHSVSGNSYLNTASGNVNYFPGTVAGTVDETSTFK